MAAIVFGIEVVAVADDGFLICGMAQRFVMLFHRIVLWTKFVVEMDWCDIIVFASHPVVGCDTIDSATNSEEEWLIFVNQLFNNLDH